MINIMHQFALLLPSLITTVFIAEVPSLVNEYSFERNCPFSHDSVQIRRTDKLRNEAAKHDVEEYMYHVEEFYRRLGNGTSNGATRRVFVATDEASVVDEIKTK